MTRQLYDLAGADSARRFSPYCWRSKLALAHKQLPVETIPWRFTEKDVIAFSKQGKVPVLLDGDKPIFDSWAIAVYLEETYPDQPSLFGGAEAFALTRFVNAWADSILLPGILRLIVADIYPHLAERDKQYFRSSREERLGMSLEACCADRDRQVGAFRQTLAPLRISLRTQPFLGGNTPNYADYSVFGGFQWARCVSDFPLLASDDTLAQWAGRMLDAFDGLARRTPGYATLG